MINIRDAAPADSDPIRQTVRQAFGEDTEADLIEALRESGDAAIELVADEDGNIAGHVLLSKLQAPDQCVALAPVSVLPDNQERGVGSALIREAIERAKAGGWLAMFLLGEPEYYSRFGFTIEGCAKFETPYPKAYMMALDLTEDSLSRLSGDLRFADAFGRISLV